MKVICIFVILLAGVAVSSAEETWTLNDCLLYAREHAYKNRTQRMDTKIAHENERISISKILPGVDAYANGTMSFGRNIDPETNTYDNKQTLSTGYGIQFSLPVFDGLVKINNIKAAKVARMKAYSSERIQEDMVALEIVKSFYQVSYCKAMVAQMEKQLAVHNVELKSVERGMELGTKSGADVAEVKALVANDEFELLNQRNSLDNAYLNLRSLMGLPLNEDSLNLIEKNLTVRRGEGRELPQIEEARHSLKKSLYDLRASRGSYYPSISFTAGVSTSYYRMVGNGYNYPSFKRQLRDNLGEYLSLSISIPLFDGLSTTFRVRQAKAALIQSQIRLEETMYDLEKELKEAELNYMSACKEYEAAVAKEEADGVAYALTRRKFELGDASAIDLSSSASKLSASRALVEGKRIQKIINLILLRYYEGDSLLEL